MALVAAWTIVAFANVRPASAIDCAQTNCDDNNECTADGCDETTGCFHKGVSCDDSNACTQDSCNPITGCVHTLDCNDNNACTRDFCDSEDKVCRHATQDCNDNIACTKDTCDVVMGCGHFPVHDQCNDNILCTNDTCDVALGCIHNPTCALGDTCTGNSPPECVDNLLCNGGICVTRNPAPAVSDRNTIFIGAALLLAGLWQVRRLAARRR